TRLLTTAPFQMFFAQPPSCSSLAGTCVLGAMIDFIPIDILKKRINVPARICPIVHVIGMFVHVHHQQRYSPRKTARMIPRPVMVHGVLARVVVQNDPARATAES